jgi:hypothetical protein
VILVPFALDAMTGLQSAVTYMFGAYVWECKETSGFLCIGVGLG